MAKTRKNIKPCLSNSLITPKKRWILYASGI